MANKSLEKISVRIKKHKATFIVYIILRILVVACLIVALFRKDFQSAFICGLSLVLFSVPSFLAHRLKITLPSTLEVIILLFIFAAEILGELGYYYVRVPHWDTILHTVNGFLCAAIGFALIDILNTDKTIKFELSPLFVSVVSLCFSMTVGILWEFFEFFSDMLLRTDMQKDFIVNNISSIALDETLRNRTVRIDNISSIIINGKTFEGGYIDIGLIDTMKDLLVNFAGAVVFSFIGYFYIKNRGRGKIAEKFIPKPQEETQKEAQ